LEDSLTRRLLRLGLVAGVVSDVAPAAMAAEAAEGSAQAVVDDGIASSGIPATIASPAGIVGDLKSASGTASFVASTR
jgi:hypothetical protein